MLIEPFGKRVTKENIQSYREQRKGKRALFMARYQTDRRI